MNYEIAVTGGLRSSLIPSSMPRLSYRLYRLVSSALYAAPRRFTPAGLLALSALAVSGAIGIDMDQTVAFQGFALLVCVLGVSIGTAAFFRGRFEVERVLPRFASVGQPFSYHLAVSNRGSKPWRDLEVLEDLADPRPSRAEYLAARRVAAKARSFRVAKGPGSSITRNRRWEKLRPVPLPAMPAHSQVEARMEVTPLRRGPLRFTGATIARADALGIFRGFVKVTKPGTVLVLPRRYPVPALELPGARQHQRGGVTHASAIGDSEEFVSLRDYRPGDPLRHIHWKSWARTGRPIVKEFQDEFFVRHALILDTFATDAQAEAFEEAVSVAASFACTVATQESLLDLMFVGPQAVCFTAGRGVAHTEQALEILAGVQPCHEKPFRALEELVARHAPAVSGCICVLLDWDQPRRELVRQLQALDRPMLVVVVTTAAQAEAIRSSDEVKPAAFQVLELGKVAEGLQQLGGFRV